MALSHETLIIIVVCASVGGLVVALVIIRLIHRLCISPSQKSVPLPPVQPLAHHREQQIAKVQNRQATTSSYLSAPAPFTIASDLRSSHSSGSLLRKGSPVPSSPSRSILASDTGEDISLSHEVLPAALVPLPNTSFQVPPSESDVSLSSAELASYPPGVTSPSSIRSHSSSNSRRARSSSSHSTRRPHHRAFSTVSSAASTARSSRRGLPHDPHNPMQIVLPAPLAPMVYGQPTLPSDSARLSVVDMWAPRAVRSESSLRHEGVPANIVSPSHSQSNLRSPKRMTSLPPFPSPLSSSSIPPSPYGSEPSYSHTSPPPVPPIPSVYHSPVSARSNTDLRHAGPFLQDSDFVPDSRGRSTIVGGSQVADGQIQSGGSSYSKHRTLSKQRKSRSRSRGPNT